MPDFVHLLRCVGRAAFRNAGRALARLIPLGETAFDIAHDACAEYRKAGEASPPRVIGPYTVGHLVVAGDVADVIATGEAAHLLKVSRSREGDALLANERRSLGRLIAAAGSGTYRAYLPELVEAFSTADVPSRAVNVFRQEPGWFTLEQVRGRHPALDGRHLAWVFKRLLTVLGFCHQQGVLHGAVLPCHALIHPESHSLRLVGWGQSVAVGRPVLTLSPRFTDWYPPEVRKSQPASEATDIYLAARCVLQLAGDVPPAMRRFFETCLLEGMRMRPSDAWALQDEFDVLLGRLYGPPKFHPLSMS